MPGSHAGAAGDAVQVSWLLPVLPGNVVFAWVTCCPGPAWAHLTLLVLPCTWGRHIIVLQNRIPLEQEAHLADVKPEEENSQTPRAALNSEKPKHFAKPPTPQGFPSPKYLIF